MRISTLFILYSWNTSQNNNAEQYQPHLKNRTFHSQGQLWRLFFSNFLSLCPSLSPHVCQSVRRAVGVWAAQAHVPTVRTGECVTNTMECVSVNLDTWAPCVRAVRETPAHTQTHTHQSPLLRLSIIDHTFSLSQPARWVDLAWVVGYVVCVITVGSATRGRATVPVLQDGLDPAAAEVSKDD